MAEIEQIFSQNMHSVPPSEQGEKFRENIFKKTFFVSNMWLISHFAHTLIFIFEKIIFLCQ